MEAFIERRRENFNPSEQAAGAVREQEFERFRRALGFEGGLQEAFEVERNRHGLVDGRGLTDEAREKFGDNTELANTFENYFEELMGHNDIDNLNDAMERMQRENPELLGQVVSQLNELPEENAEAQEANEISRSWEPAELRALQDEIQVQQRMEETTRGGAERTLEEQIRSNELTERELEELIRSNDLTERELTLIDENHEELTEAQKRALSRSERQQLGISIT